MKRITGIAIVLLSCPVIGHSQDSDNYKFSDTDQCDFYIRSEAGEICTIVDVSDNSGDPVSGFSWVCPKQRECFFTDFKDGVYFGVNSDLQISVSVNANGMPLRTRNQFLAFLPRFESEFNSFFGGLIDFD